MRAWMMCFAGRRHLARSKASFKMPAEPASWASGKEYGVPGSWAHQASAAAGWTLAASASPFVSMALLLALALAGCSSGTEAAMMVVDPPEAGVGGAPGTGGAAMDAGGAGGELAGAGGSAGNDAGVDAGIDAGYVSMAPCPEPQ